MEEEVLSMISYANKANMNEESSDSNCSIYISHPNNNKRRIVKERFKGVVPQQNGHSGAQTYADHKRIWLGTFKSEVDAAMAYDSANLVLRSGDCSHRNFPATNITLLEIKFQAHFSTDDILSMIRDGSYPSKFADFLRNKQGLQMEIGRRLNPWSVQTGGGFSCTLLFQKELTPSDVGKLNRLVIPKRYAVKHFPKVSESSEQQQQNSDDAQRSGQVELEFYDMKMNLWKFRYCYWKSSQSFVFTKGWNRFVKEKGLRANDTIAFYTCERSQGDPCFGQPFLVVDVALRRNNIDHNNTMKLDIGRKQDKFVEILDHDSTPNNDSKGIRLFGVQIDHRL